MKKLIIPVLISAATILISLLVLFVVILGLGYSLVQLEGCTKIYGLILQIGGVTAVIYGIHRKLIVYNKRIFKYQRIVNNTFVRINEFTKAMPDQILNWLQGKSIEKGVRFDGDTMEIKEGGDYLLNPTEIFPETLPDTISYFNKKINHLHENDRVLKEKITAYLKHTTDTIKSTQSELSAELKSKTEPSLVDMRV